MLFCFAEVAQGSFCFFKTSADTVGVVGLVREAVHGDDDTVESGRDELLSEGLGECLRVGRDDGIEACVMGFADHERQVFVEQGFALEIELHGMGCVADLRKDTMPYDERHEFFEISRFRDFEISKTNGTGGAFQLADRGRFDGDECGHMRTTHQAEEAQCVVRIATQGVNAARFC